MAINTYATLQTALQNWLARADADIVARIPEFIDLAEAQFNRDIKHRSMEVQTTLNAVGGVETVALPADYIEARALVVESNPKSVLTLVTPQQLATNWAVGLPGVPTEYTIIGSNLHLGALPDAAYDMTLTYYQEIPALTDSATTNWLLTSHPDMYMYGALIQAAPYLMDDARIPVWGANYTRGLEGLANSQNRSAWNGGPLVSRVDIFTG